MADTIRLLGRIILSASIQTSSGLHIGGSGNGLEIGDIDKIVIRNPITRQPYIPGSSLRGKMRSLTEKVNGLPMNTRVGNAKIHTCQSASEYQANGGCKVCSVFGVPAERGVDAPTRLLVRDVNLTTDSIVKLQSAHTDMPFTEIKTEVAIDRITSAANPRTLERVPAGVEFGPAELVFSLYSFEDVERFKTIVEALQLVEDDYLGGAGSRGSGKVNFTNISLKGRRGTDYTHHKDYPETFESVQKVANSLDEILSWIMSTIVTE